jgi:hypothetical protein
VPTALGVPGGGTALDLPGSPHVVLLVDGLG